MRVCRQAILNRCRLSAAGHVAGALRSVGLPLRGGGAADSGWGDAGGVEVRGTPGDDGGYVIEVADRGAGFADAEKDRVFEPFFSGRAGGTGLGLAVCQGIVTAHGGRIDIADREGGGAVVKVELPARPPVTTAPEAPA